MFDKLVKAVLILSVATGGVTAGAQQALAATAAPTAVTADGTSPTTDTTLPNDTPWG